MHESLSPTNECSVSIITVCFNGVPDQIRYTIDSVLNQRNVSREIILIDGGSDELTMNCLNSYSEKFSFFVSERDSGIYDAMNKGLAHAGGEWVVFMNIGDRFHSNQTLSGMLRPENLVGDPWMIYGDTLMRDPARPWWVARVPERISRFFLFGGMVCHQSMLVKRSAFEKIGVFNTAYRLLCDKDWLFRFLEAGLASRHCQMTVCDWDVRGASSNLEAFNRERSVLRNGKYSKFERALYPGMWTGIKILERLRSATFQPARVDRIGEH
ncbi:MAG: glycosyltransferase family 2 protein [Syntrophobacteraceae bacterium]